MPLTRCTLFVAVAATLSTFADPAHSQQVVATLSDWVSTTPFDGPRTSHAAFVAGNRLYVLGGLRSSGGSTTLLDDIQVAEVGNDGAVLSTGWRAVGRIPSARSGHGVVSYRGRVYLVGGYTEQGTLGETHVAQIKADGRIDPWIPSAGSLNIPRSNLSLQIWRAPSGQAYLLAIGGVDQVGSDTVHFDEVEAAPLADDGSVGAWRVCPFHVKGGRSAPGTAVVGDDLVVVGGWGDLLDDVFADIQTGPLREDGCPGPWTTSPRPLALPVYGHSVVAFAGPKEVTAFVLGGNAGQGNYLNTVQTLEVRPNGQSGRLGFDSHLFTTPRWGHATVRYNDYVYVLGGARRGGDGYLSDVQFTHASAP